MSGQQIGTAVGFVAGFFLPGGPQVWATIGGIAGSYISPTKFKAPSIGDAQTQTSQTGMPIPKAFGHPPPFAPTLVDGDKIARKIKKESGGKGAPPVTESEGFIATRAFLIGEPIAAIARLTRNGKLVYSTIEGDELDADSAAFASQLRIYYGSRDQDPDPSLEALRGVGNTPCYPGRAYFVVVDDDETQTQGAANQYRVEVIAKGSRSSTCDQIEEGLIAWWPLDDATGGGSARELVAGRNGTYSNDGGESTGPALFPGGGPSFRMTTIYNFMFAGYAGIFTADRPEFTVQVWGMLENDGTGGADSGASVRNIATNWGDTLGGARDWSIALNGTDNLVPEGLISGAAGISAPSRIAEGQAKLFTITKKVGGQIKFYIGRDLIGSDTAGAPTVVASAVAVGGYAYPASYGFIGCASNLKLYDYEKSAEQVARDALSLDDYLPLPDSPNLFVNVHDGSIVGGCFPRSSEDETTWEEVATEICSRVDARMLTHIDFSNMTDLVPGFLLGNTGLKGSDYLRTLNTFYFANTVEYDGKLRSVRLGGAIAGTLNPDDLLTVEDQDDDLREQPIAGWSRLTLVYPDPANKYVASTQTAPRTSPDVSANSEVKIECPIPFDGTRAAQVADILQKIKFCELEGTFKRAFPAEYDKYIPSDAVMWDGRRNLILKKSFDLGMVQFEGRYDRASAYTSVAIGTAAPPPSKQTSNTKGPTLCVPFNAPTLRSSDNVPGIYVALRGLFDGWPGCLLQISVDGQESWINAGTYTSASVVGKLVNDVATGSAREPVTVSLSSGGQVETISDTQFNAGLNRFAMVTAGIAEIAQFKTADENSDGTFDLTDIESGELGSEEVAHDAGDAFVLCDLSVNFVKIDPQYAGQTIYIRPVTLGTPAANNEIFALVFDPPVFFHDGGTVTP